MTSFEDFPMIEVKKMNETEVRLFALLFNLLREPKGISFQKFRNIMPRFYKNEDIESDRKKLYRDLNQLKSLGFNIKVAQFGYQSEDYFPYYLEKESISKSLQFTKEELEYLSKVLYSQEPSAEGFSLSQKLFSNHLDLLPKFAKQPKQDSKSEEEPDSSHTEKILQAIKDKRALTIQYGFESNERIIEPYRLVRKNTTDFYLLAYDRGKKSLRRFILPRITVKKESKEEFLSNLKITKEDLNFHPLQITKHPEMEISFQINPDYEDRWRLFLEGANFEKTGNEYKVKTTNQNALFQFLILSPEALVSTSEVWKESFQTYTQNWETLYQFV
ncbi:WYL domain-containing protein [Leptospira bandrabouensis]|uniref:WYL domain-containing protein n=1 Tax=Leptospira bandrabouensis TaxID=2484903 RepID=A0A6H3NSP0_9LEPT|nr:WYL domain-containing protein [Leptospira bandrabouensis]MCW7458197.1 WYL domain-containing protein [Leptospira bandrabouensis]MCW7476859.1 WYL domain-containing protein [Leptospira bandrabouensis]MCW7484541.1 WYL domain-containing protein [Leptospira bandrabouensis]TGN04629.1 WYL domain-containing protein [Leptospira bandrabouensis]TGN14958.1 WYL domain-containing protein [Leptospira bandrabouensis]